MSKEKEALISKAHNFSRKGKFPEAINAYTEALKFDPTDIRITLTLAELYVKNNEVANAITFFQSGASYLIKDCFYSRAIPALKRILEFSPDNEEVLISIHNLYGKLGLLSEAEVYAEKLRSICEIELSVPAKMAGKKKRQSRQRLKGGLIFKHQLKKNRSKSHRKSLKVVKKS